MKKCMVKVKIYVNPLGNLFNPPKGGLPSLSEVFEEFVKNNYNMKLDGDKFYQWYCKEAFKPVYIKISCEAGMLLEKIPDKYKPEFFYWFNRALEEYADKLLGKLLGGSAR